MKAMMLPLGLSLTCSALALPAKSETIKFSGYEWELKSGDSLGPGPNQWSAGNVRVDASGALHLKITSKDGKWHCAEIASKKKFGFGRYQFQIAGRLDQFDKNIVLGIFNYPTPEVGGDGTNEIDIEFAHWGDLKNPIGNFTVWPPLKETKNNSNTFKFVLKNEKTTQRFEWKSDSLLFQSLRGYRNDNAEEFAHWLLKPENAKTIIPQNPEPVLINLWLFQGNPPSDGREVEIVVKSFKFTPLNEKSMTDTSK